MHTRILVLFASLVALALSGCAQPLREPAPVEAPVPDATPLRFTVDAGMNDTWNAVGQLLVRMPGVTYDGRAQMLGLNAIRFRGETLMVLTRAVPLSETVTTLTTEVVVAASDGRLMHSEGAAELMAALERALPTEIERVRAGLAAQHKAAQPSGTPKKKKRSKR